jgi:aspartyl-tRNA synthetase
VPRQLSLAPSVHMSLPSSSSSQAIRALKNCRSHGCGTLREADVGETITICGWVDKYRNLGGVLFLDIRDHSGILQVVSDTTAGAAVAAVSESLRQEWVVAVTGTLKPRKDVNERLPTGRVELVAESVSVLNSVTRRLPFPVSESDEQDPPRCGNMYT